jgi:hypothetical protein
MLLSRSLFIILGGNVICLDYWGRRSGPYLQALHFCLSLGLLTGPFLIAPLSDTEVPNFVQTAIKLGSGRPHSTNQTTTAAPSIMTNEMRTPKYSINFRSKRSLDPLLEKIFRLQKQPHKTTISPEMAEIQEAIKLMQKDIQLSEKLIQKLSKNNLRPKRSILGAPRNRDELGRPILYGQSNRRVPNPYQPLPPVRQSWERGYERPDYDIYSDLTPFGDDSGTMGFVPKEPPPKKVIDAIQTVDKFFKGENITDDETTTIKSTTTTTTTTTKTTTTSTSTTTSTTTTTTTTTTLTTTTTSTTERDLNMTSKKHLVKTKKDSHLTLKKALGVSEHKLGFVLNAMYDIAVALILVLCLCYNPRSEPRSRQEDTPGGNKSSEENRIFRWEL